MKESDVLSAILDYLRFQRCFFVRMNTGATKIGDRFIRFGKKGMPDVYALKDGISYWIEVKTDKGKVSAEQEEFLKSVKYHGGVGIVARSVEDVEKVI